jgi:hypothetical protein
VRDDANEDCGHHFTDLVLDRAADLYRERCHDCGRTLRTIGREVLLAHLYGLVDPHRTVD